jgi:hypothetical protein
LPVKSSLSKKFPFLERPSEVASKAKKGASQSSFDKRSRFLYDSAPYNGAYQVLSLNSQRGRK